MAKLKSLRIKSKEFVFTSFGNADEGNPAKIIFSRFPIMGEVFTPIDKKDIFDGVNTDDISKHETKARISENIVNAFIKNITAGKTDHKQFFLECVDSFKDFEYGDSKIVTVNDFWQMLPQDAAVAIAQEAFEYANERDEFTMGNSNA
jgi:hypothetical protein